MCDGYCACVVSVCVCGKGKGVGVGRGAVPAQQLFRGESVTWRTLAAGRGVGSWGGW